MRAIERALASCLNKIFEGKKINKKGNSSVSNRLQSIAEHIELRIFDPIFVDSRFYSARNYLYTYLFVSSKVYLIVVLRNETIQR